MRTAVSLAGQTCEQHSAYAATASITFINFPESLAASVSFYRPPPLQSVLSIEKGTGMGCPSTGVRKVESKWGWKVRSELAEFQNSNYGSGRQTKKSTRKGQVIAELHRKRALQTPSSLNTDLPTCFHIYLQRSPVKIQVISS